MKKILLGLALLIYSQLSSALVGVGSFVPNAFRVQDNPEGKADIFTFNPYMSLHTVVPIKGRHFFNPEIGLVMHTGEEDNTNVNTLFLSYNLTYRADPLLVFRYGTTTFVHMNGGDGGEVKLNNGTSTSTYYVPDKSKSSYVSTLDLGVEMFGTGNVSFRFQTYIARFLSKEKRGVYYTLSLNIY